MSIMKHNNNEVNAIHVRDEHNDLTLDTTEASRMTRKIKYKVKNSKDKSRSWLYVLQTLCALYLLSGFSAAYAGITIDPNASDTAMGTELVGTGFIVNGVTIIGEARQSASYTNGSVGGVGFAPADTGLLFTTSNAERFDNGDDRNNALDVLINSPGDADIAAVNPNSYFDASGIIIDVNPVLSGTVNLELTFLTEEFPDFYQTTFSDIAGVFLKTGAGPFVLQNANGTPSGYIEVNALDPNPPINNGGNNSTLNVATDYNAGQSYTVPLTFTSGVNYQVKIVVADQSDSFSDSALLVGGGVLTFPAPPGPELEVPEVDPTTGIATIGGQAPPGNTVKVILPDGTILTPTVAPDGTFDFEIPAGVNPGDVAVTHTNPEGSESEVTNPAPSAESPAPTADSATVNSDGTVAVAGSGGIPGNAPVALDESGNPIAGATCAPDPIEIGGLFTCTLPVGTDVNDVNLAQTDPSGQTSDSAPAPLPSAPPAPTLATPSVDSSTGIASVSGTAVPGNAVTVMLPDGTVLTPTVAPDGSFTFDVPVGVDPSAVTVTQTDASGQTSDEGNPDKAPVPPAPTLAPPSVDSSTGIASVSGTAVPGNVVTVTLPDGTVLTPTVAPDGSFTFDVPAGVDPSAVTVTQTDASGQTSDEGNPDKAPVPPAPTLAPPSVDAATGIASVSGTAVPGNVVTVTLPDGTVLTPTVAPDGSFTFEVPAGVDPSAVTVTQTDASGQASDEGNPDKAPAPPVPTLATPSVDAATGVASVSGAAVPGNVVTVTLPDGTVLTPTVAPDGSFTFDVPAGVDPSAVTVTQTDASGQTSDEGNPDKAPVPPAPTLAPPSVDAATGIASVSGTAVPGNVVTVTLPDGTVLTPTVAPDGSFTFDVPAGVDPSTVTVTQTDASGQTSDEGNPDKAPAPPAPTLATPSVDSSTGVASVSGTAVPGNVVTVTLPDGTVLTPTVAPDGSFTFEVPAGVDPSAVTVTQTDASGQTSDEGNPDKAPAPPVPTLATPSVDAATGVASVSGAAVPGNVVTVTLPDGTVLTPTVAPDGSFTFDVPAGVDPSAVTVTQTDVSGQTSDEGNPDKAPAPPAPTLATPSVDSSTGVASVSGTAVPGNVVTVTLPDGTVLTPTVAPDGSFTFEVPAGVDPSAVTVTQTDASGQTSDEGNPDKAPAPPVPTLATPSVDSSTGIASVSGTAVPGNVVTVTLPDGTVLTPTVAPDGSFTFDVPAGVDPSAVTVTQTDASGQTSDEGNPDKAPAPPAPTLATPSVDSSTGIASVSGTAVPGNVVTVTLPDGTVLTPTVAPDGSFTFDVPAGVDPSAVTVTQTDASGQTSDEGNPDKAPAPPAPTLATPSVDSSTGIASVSGTAVPGNVVTVTLPDGTVLTPTVAPDGSFTFDVPAGVDPSTVTVTQTDASGQTSDEGNPDKAPAPPAPTLAPPSVDSSTGIASVSGTAVPGNVVTVTLPDGTVLTPTVAPDGSFTFDVPAGVDPSAVTVTQTDASGQASDEGNPDKAPAPAAPAVDGTTVNPDGSIVVAGSGGVPGNTPVAIDDNGDPITGAVCTPNPIGSDGKFTCTLPTGTDVNDVNLAQTDPSGQTSGGTAAPLPAGPAAPAVSGSTVNPDGTIAVAATGIPGNKPSVVDEDGNPITDAVCTPDPIGVDGAFTCTLPVGTDVNDVSVAQTDPSGQTSAKTAAPLPTGPAAPETDEPSINDQGETEITVKPTPVPGNRYSVTDKDGNVIAGATCSPDPVTSASDVVTCTLPAGTEGPVNMMVTDPSGQSASSQPIELDDNDGVSAEDEKAAVEALEKVLTPEEAAALGLDQAAVMPNMAVLMDKPNADAKGSDAASPLLVQAPASGSACGTPKFTSMKLIQEGESGIAGGQGNVGVTYSSPDSTTYDFPHGLVEFQLECANKTVANGEKSTVNLVFTGLNPDVPLSAYEIVKLTVNGEYKPAANVVGVTLMADDSGLGVADQEGKVMVVTVEVQDDSAEGDFVTAGDHEAAEQMKLLDPIGPAIRTSAGGVTLDKRVNKSEAAVGDFVRYTLVLEDTDEEANGLMEIADFFPHKGLNYVTDSAKVTVNGTETDATVVDAGKTLSISGLPVVPAGGKLTVSYLAQVNAAASGEYVNKARAGVSAAMMINGINTGATNEGTATVKVGEDPILDKLTVIGKVFDDANANGVQDDGEMGIPGARLVTLKGQIITTDSAGRYHVPAVSAGQRDNGRNFYIKLDVRSLSKGYEVTTENPMVQRITPGLMSRINFGVRQAAPAE